MKNTKIKSRRAAIDICADGGVVVAVGNNGGSRCYYFESIDLLGKVVKAGKVKVGEWILTVSRNECILKKKEFPADDMGQAVEMAGFELEELVPMDSEGLCYGCLEAGRNEGMLVVWVCIVKKEKIERCVEACRDNGLRISKAVIDVEGIREYFKGRGSGSYFVGDENRKTLAVYDLNGFLVKAEQVNSEGEINASDDVICLGKGTNRPAIECFESGKKIDGRTHSGVVCSGLLKVGSLNGKYGFNLLPREYLKKQAKKQLLKNVLSVALLAASVVVMCFVLQKSLIWRVGKEIKRYEKEMAPILAIARDIEVKRELIRAYNLQTEQKGVVGGILCELYKYSPAGISLSEMSFESKAGKSSLQVKGKAKSLSEAFSYTEAVKGSKYLGGLNIENVAQVPLPGGGSVVEFKAHCFLLQPTAASKIRNSKSEFRNNVE